MKVSLKSVTPNAEINLVEIARVSSSRENKSESPEILINYLIKKRHWSPFEHNYMTLEIVTSRAIGVQLLRHRSFTFQEFSQRYAEVVDIEPIELRKQAIKNRQSSEENIGHMKFLKIPGVFSLDSMDERVKEHISNTLKLYKELINNNVAKECARFILPMSTQTTLHMTGNIRSWIHMLQIRDDSHAQKEVQLIAKECKVIFIDQFPLTSEALGWI